MLKSTQGCLYQVAVFIFSDTRPELGLRVTGQLQVPLLEDPLPACAPAGSAPGFPLLRIPANTCRSVFILSVLTSMRWYFLVVFICVSLMMRDVERLHVSAVCVSSSEKRLFWSFPLRVAWVSTTCQR